MKMRSNEWSIARLLLGHDETLSVSALLSMWEAALLQLLCALQLLQQALPCRNGDERATT